MMGWMVFLQIDRLEVTVALLNILAVREQMSPPCSLLRHNNWLQWRVL